MEQVSTQPDRPGGDSAPEPTRPRRLRGFGIVGGVLAAVALSAAVASWALTADLEPPSAVEARPLESPGEKAVQCAEQKLESLEWPQTTLEGDEATKLLLRSLQAARQRLEASAGYTATMRRQERINGQLGPEQTMAMKVKHHPFAIYLKFLKPDAGREVVYAKGRYDDDVIAHPGGFGRAFLPRLKVAPDSSLAMAGNRHPVTDAGLLNLTNKLIWFRKLDLTDDEAETVLDRVTDSDGRHWLRSVHTHPHKNPDRPFMYIEVLYDPETKIPMRISSYAWPEPGDDGERKLAERYEYDVLDLDAPLTDLDFDPANPEYEFKRF